MAERWLGSYVLVNLVSMLMAKAILSTEGGVGSVLVKPMGVLMVNEIL